MCIYHTSESDWEVRGGGRERKYRKYEREGGEEAESLTAKSFVCASQ